MEKPKFFFEADNQGSEFSLTTQEHADTFFSTLKSIGTIQEGAEGDLEAKKVEADAFMKKLEDKVLSIEYGTYQDNYAIHVTPVHPSKNLRDDNMVKRALREIVVILNDYVPIDVNVKIFPPSQSWKVKVLSFVVENGANVWSFNTKKLEEEGIPRIKLAVEKVVLS